MSSSRFTSDPLAVPLARGERPPTWGLNLNAFPQGHPDLEAAYRAWTAAAAPVLAPAHCYLYPFEYTHVTAASPAPFTNPALASWSEQDRAEYAALWLVALRETCVAGNAAGVEWPSAPFPLHFSNLELKNNCAIFSVGDPTGGVAKARAAVAAASRHRALATGRGAELLARAGWKTPNIVHSSIMRFVEPRGTIPDAEVEAAWARAAALWTPVTVMAQEMTYIVEAVAYQHITPGEGLIASFPYAPE